MLIIASEYFIKPVNNTRVLTCWVDYWCTGCISGLLIYRENNLHRDNLSSNSAYIKYVITKNNGLTRLLYVSNYLRIYSIVFTFPRELWILVHTIVIGYLALDLIIKLKYMYRKVFGEVDTVSTGLLIALVLNASIVGATYIDQTITIYTIPGVRVESFFNINNSTLTLVTHTHGIYTLQNAYCFTTGNYTNRVLEPNNIRKSVNNIKFNIRNSAVNKTFLEAIVENSTVKVIIPKELYVKIYNELRVEPLLAYRWRNLTIDTHIPVYCRLYFDKGVLDYKTIIEIEWRELDIKLLEHRVVVNNLNPVSINFKIAIVDAYRRIVVHIVEYTVESLSTIEIEVPVMKTDWEVYVNYVFAGVHRSVVLNASW